MRSPTSLLSIHKFCRYLTTLLLLVAAIALSGCDKGSEADAPTNVVLTPGEGKITVTWTMQPGVQYWLFYAPAPNITVDNWLSLPGSAAVANVTSPYVLSGLTNGTTYAITLNGRYNNGPGGPGTASLTETPRPAGGSWTLGTTLGTNDLRADTYGTAFVTAGAGGVVYSSSDGSSWTPQTSGISTDLLGITYSGQYIAVGAGGVILTSANAATWTSQTSGTSNDLFAVVSNGSGLFVAIGANGTILTSNGGSTWTPATSGTANALYGITYANSLFVVVGASGTLLTSPDGSTWTSVGSGTAQNLYGVAYGAGMYCAVGASGTLTSSTDGGSTWNVQVPIGANTLRAVKYASQFVTVGDSGAIYTSTDGITWPSQTSGTGNILYAIAHGNSGYSVVGASGTNLTAY